MKTVNNKYQCGECGKEFYKYDTYHRHLEAHMGLKCDVCGKGYARKNNLRRHMKRKHGVNSVSAIRQNETRNNRHHCDQCEKNYATRKGLRDHKLYKHTPNDQKRKYVCEKCGKVYFNRQSYRSHREAHVRFKCDECDKSFTTKQSLKGHKDKNHRNKVPEFKYKCDECEKNFISSGGLWLHKNSKHPRSDKQQKYLCDTCGELYLDLTSFTAHLKSHFYFECDKCEKCFATTDSLKMHRVKVHDEKDLQFQCDVCDKKYKTSDGLRDHKRYKHPQRNLKQEQYLCEKCGKIYFNQRSFVSHLEAHVRFKCDECQRSFTTRNSLKEHKNRTHGDKVPAFKFKCDHCDLVFDTNADLTSHIKLHLSQKKPHNEYPGDKSINLREGISTRNEEGYDDNNPKTRDATVTAQLEHTKCQTFKCNPNKQYSCDKCGKIYLNEISYRIHRLRIVNCDDCEKSFCTKLSLKEHKDANHVEKAADLQKKFVDGDSEYPQGDKQQRYLCNINEDNITSTVSLDMCRSIKTHTNKSGKECSAKHRHTMSFFCVPCNVGFNNPKAYRLHKTNHLYAQNLICDTCKLDYIEKDLYDYHVKLCKME